MSKPVSGMMLILVLIVTFFVAFEAKPVKTDSVIVVPDHFAKIQEAINNAIEGDTIFVRKGTYYENIVVNKSITLIGEEKSSTIIDGSHAGNVVYIAASYVNLTGFTIKNSGTDYSCGVQVGEWAVPSKYNNISGNIIMDNYYGLLLTGCFDSTVSNNALILNTIGIQDQSRGWDCDIWTMNADGTNQTRLTDGEMWDDGPEWYPHDSKILYERSSDPLVGGQSWDIWVMNVDGTNKTRLTWDSQQNMLGGWSPNASLIVYDSKESGNQDIWIMDADGTNHRQLTTDSGYDTMPTWSPDGAKIAFVSNRTGNQDLWVMNADGTNQTQLTSGIPWVMGGTWSPDSSKITFHSIEGGWSGNWDIWVINSDGTNPHKLTSSSFREAFPHWSPDGTKIAYGSDETGGWDIYSMNPDGTNPTRITTEWDTEEICSWGPDGSRLAFARAQWWLPSYNKIVENEITDNNETGVFLKQVQGVLVNRNLIIRNGHGLIMTEAHGCLVTDNTIAENLHGVSHGFVEAGMGIYMDRCRFNTFEENALVGNSYNLCIDAHVTEEYENYMDESNTINGKPICYWINQQDRTVPTNAACVLLVNSTNIRVENVSVSHNGFGVLFWLTTNSTIRNAEASHNGIGICLQLSPGNILTNNTAVDNIAQGGIQLMNSGNSTLRNNVMARNLINFGVTSGPTIIFPDYYNDIDESNIVDDKPIYYWMDQHNKTVPSHGGVAYLINCTNIIIKDMNISNNLVGVGLLNTNNSLVENVNIQNCSVGIGTVSSHNNVLSNCKINGGIAVFSPPIGIFMNDCNNNTLKCNTISNITGFWQYPQPSSGTGLILYGNDNRIFLNSFVNNTVQVITQNALNNAWDNGFEGNFWSDYVGVDIDGDGIGDAPYVIDENNMDNYPLMSPYLYADVNHDAVVNMRDIGLCCNAFGSYLGHPNWNPHCDINEDGIVNMRDIGIVCNNFMKT